MKRIGLIDVDSHHYPNLPLMKISAWHKKQGDYVEWYDPWKRWCNNFIFWKVPTFEDYKRSAT